MSEPLDLTDEQVEDLAKSIDDRMYKEGLKIIEDVPLPDIEALFLNIETGVVKHEDVIKTFKDYGARIVVHCSNL